MEKQNSNKNTNKTHIQIQFERNGHTMFFTGGSREFEILRKDTIAGKCAFSLFSVYSCNFSLFQFIVCFFRMQRYDTEGRRVGESRGIEGNKETYRQILCRGKGEDAE